MHPLEVVCTVRCSLFSILYDWLRAADRSQTASYGASSLSAFSRSWGVSVVDSIVVVWIELQGPERLALLALFLIL
jgi:hypothetical protein